MKMVIAITKGIRDMNSRRWIMFAGPWLAGDAFAGATILTGCWLAGHGCSSGIGRCGVGDLLIFLLAVYDMLALRAKARQARRNCSNRYSAAMQIVTCD